ncbi:acyl-CoA thioesterase [Pedobacter metabolipauper]|uniref:Acyl-CoA thioester hydrolase n=1 Tax=Pedobacter metabolipauper TaxID=425513 RepID=A0A4R6T2A9_9SPHI|nr:thioesterase family protein [Pedobacter metabolipauper]TDQ11471.1 acyl-CoA thioester hydrolase [Pedobacter metabolipauper]
MIFKTLWRSKPKETDRKSDIVNQLDSFKYKTNIETRFADFDSLGHVNNAIYFTYMEIARTKYWGHAIHWDWKKTGVIIASATLDYITPIFMEDKISMYVRTSRIGKSSFDLEYLLVKMKNNEEVICSKGKTVCVAFDYQSKNSSPIPPDERNKMMVFEQLSE